MLMHLHIGERTVWAAPVYAPAYPSTAVPLHSFLSVYKKLATPAMVTTGYEPSPMLTGLPLIRKLWHHVRDCPELSEGDRLLVDTGDMFTLCDGSGWWSRASSTCTSTVARPSCA